MKSVSLGLTILLAVTGAAVGGEGALNDGEITGMVKGKRLSAVGPGAAAYRLTFKEDGTLAGNEGHSADTGKWWVDAGKLCIKWNTWKYDGCGKLVKAGSEVKLMYPAEDEKTYLTFN